MKLSRALPAAVLLHSGTTTEASSIMEQMQSKLKAASAALLSGRDEGQIDFYAKNNDDVAPIDRNPT